MCDGMVKRAAEYCGAVYELVTCFLILMAVGGCVSTARNEGKSSWCTELKYSAYNRHLNEKTDSLDFYLSHYIEIDSSGRFALMRHDTNGNRRFYFTGHLTSAICEQIDTILRHGTYKTDYMWHVNSGFIYDGYTYTLDYKSRGEARKGIQFIPNNSPATICVLGKLLDSVIINVTTHRTDTMYFANYTDELSKSYPRNIPPRAAKPPVKFAAPARKNN